ncbi:MAG: hypothetical protein RI885_2264 [Actinomycetota bacterium]|jgi:hypothetical protein
MSDTTTGCTSIPEPSTIVELLDLRDIYGAAVRVRVYRTAPEDFLRVRGLPGEVPPRPEGAPNVAIQGSRPEDADAGVQMAWDVIEKSVAFDAPEGPIRPAFARAPKGGTLPHSYLSARDVQHLVKAVAEFSMGGDASARRFPDVAGVPAGGAGGVGTVATGDGDGDAPERTPTG